MDILEERFLKYVAKAPLGCWLWTGTTAGSTAQYGYFSVNGRKVPAHRVAYELWVGPIPDGQEIDHVAERGCVSKLCVNPAHLEPVSHAENRRRGRLSVCRAGLHDLTDPTNLRWDSKGQRRGCLACHNERRRERYARKEN